MCVCVCWGGAFNLLHLFSMIEVKVKVTQLCPTLCDPMEFSRPEYWSG